MTARVVNDRLLITNGSTNVGRVDSVDFASPTFSVTGSATSASVSIAAISASIVNVSTSSFRLHLSGVSPNAQSAFEMIDSFVPNGCAPGPTITIPITVNTSTLDVTVAPGNVNLYKNAAYSGVFGNYNVSSSVVTLTDKVANYIVAKFNSGSISYANTLDLETINESDIVPVYSIVPSGTYVDQLTWDSLGTGMLIKLNHRLIKTQRFVRESGFSLSELSGQRISITAGVVWYGTNRVSLPSFTSDVSLTRLQYNDGAGSFATRNVTTYTNEYYDDGTGGLKALGTNKYVVNWIYRGVTDSSVSMILLSTQYNTLAQATAAVVPATTSCAVALFGMLVGRIIAQQGTATAVQIDSAFVTTFDMAGATDHNNLSNLQGGTTSQYYHLTLAEHDSLVSASFPSGLSGSLTRLTDGRSYITAGAGTSISSQSNGQITITSGRYVSASLLSAPVSGTVEYDGSSYYVTNDAGTRTRLCVINEGSTTIDFGTPTGSNFVTASISGQSGIDISSSVRAWMMADSTSDHNEYEHAIAPLRLCCGSIVSGSGFTIFASSDSRLTGQFKVRWSWN